MYKSLLATGGFFGHVMGRIKSSVAGESCGQILSDFVEKGPNFIKISFSLILSNSVQIKEILYFS